MALNQQHQRGLHQRQDQQTRLKDFLSSVQDLQKDISVCRQMIERNEEPNQDKFKTLCYKWVKFEREMNNQVEDINCRLLAQKSRR